VFYISNAMVFLRVKDLTFLSQSTAQRLGTHYYDVLLFCIMCTRHLPSFTFPYSNSTEMLGSSYLLSALPQLDMYAYIDFPQISRPKPRFGTSVASMDTSNVPIMN
jgi:hypothetical protein